MQIKLLVEVPTPEESSKPKSPCLSPEERVRHYIDLIESGHKSDVEWITLNKFYKALCKCKKTPRVQNLISMIKPVLAKYGYHGVASEGK